MKLDILAFGAHPDDVEISAGGMLISEANRGKFIGVIDLTLGELGTRGTRELRKLEAENAARIMGAKVRLDLGLPDGLFELSNENKFLIIEQIRKYKPDIVFSNAPSDRHPDHGRAAQLVVEACFLAGLRQLKLPGSNLEPWRPLVVYQYMQFYQHVPHFIYDISEVMDQKIEAVLAHKSQFYDPESTEPETVIASRQFKDNLWARASEYGLQAGFRYGEPFMVVRTPGVKDLFSLF